MQAMNASSNTTGVCYISFKVDVPNKARVVERGTLVLTRQDIPQCLCAPALRGVTGSSRDHIL